MAFTSPTVGRARESGKSLLLPLGQRAISTILQALHDDMYFGDERMAFTSQQLDALAAYAATSITLAKELAPDYPTMAATIEQNAEAVKAWADSSPVEE
jgi:replication fork clamp-binding protein CrfC